MFLRNLVKTTKLQQRLGFKFATQMVKYVQYDNQFQSSKSKSGALNPIIDSHYIVNFDDKFGLGGISDYTKILSHLQENNFQYSLNDLVYFLRRLVAIQKDKSQQIVIKKSSGFKVFLKEIKRRLQEDDHEKWPLLGSYSWCFMKLDVQDRQLWELLEHKINEDEWYTNFDESVFACEGFTMLNMFNSQDRIDSVYKRLEYFTSKTVWEVNMIHYKRIVESLVMVNRHEHSIFAKIENHVLNNLSMEYEHHVMVDILFSFARAGRGSKAFYDSMQFILFKGHMFNSHVLQQALKKEHLPYQGKSVSKVFEIYRDVQLKFPEFQMQAEFRTMIHKMITNNKTNFDLIDLTKTIQLLPYYRFEDQDEIETILLQKLINIEEHPDIEDVIETIEYFNWKFGEKLPKHVGEFLEIKFLQQLKYSPIEKQIECYEFVVKNPSQFKQNEEIFKSMMALLETKLIEMNPSQIKRCLTALEEDIKKFENQEFIGFHNKIKDYILVSSLQSKIYIE